MLHRQPSHRALSFPAAVTASNLPARTELAKSVPASQATNSHVRRFTWREIESPDYEAYIKNLRSVECPEATIRDIVLADVNQLYARKKSVEVVTTQDQWWRAEPDPAILQSSADRLKQLDSERRNLLNNLLGPGWDASLASIPPQWMSPSSLELNGPVLGELSPEKREQVAAVSQKAQQRITTYVQEQAQANQPVDPNSLARLRQQTRMDLQSILTPMEMEEFLLRYSNTASQLRLETRNLQLTPEEFRMVFRLRDPIDERAQFYASATRPVDVAEAQKLSVQKDLAMQQALSPERYQAYRSGRGPN
ncbi:MAG: hypothetical protein JWN25_1215 [Verrucomicrobiales bacterium]|nr:hypothetical protein [Verrucomicrobiales bacterium]